MLTPKIIKMLREGMPYDGELKDFYDCMRDFYDCGRQCETIERIPCPREFPERDWNKVQDFMFECYELGREDVT